MKRIILIICNETYKRLLILWDYKVNVISQLLTLTLIFLGASYFYEMLSGPRSRCGLSTSTSL